MSVKIKVGSRISVEEYECNDNSDLYDYCGEVEGIVVGIYDSNTFHTKDRVELKESNELEGITLIANFNGDYQEVDEGCYTILEV